MKTLLILGLTLGLFLVSCNKQTLEPQQVVLNQTNNDCDTVTCLGARSQGTYTFYPGNGEDTTMTGCSIRVTYDGLKDSTMWSDSTYQVRLKYRIDAINFNNNIQTLDQTKCKLIGYKASSVFYVVSFYTKSGKKGIFRFSHH